MSFSRDPNALAYCVSGCEGARAGGREGVGVDVEVCVGGGVRGGGVVCVGGEKGVAVVLT